METRGTTELSRADRERLLNSAVHDAVREGYQLLSSTGTAASLKLPKPPSALGANIVLTVITFGLWLIVWALMIAVMPVRREKSLYIEVLPDGEVERTTDGLFGGTTRNGQPEPQAKLIAGITPRTNLFLSADKSTLEVQRGVFKSTVERTLPVSSVSSVETGKRGAVTIHGPNGEFATTAEMSNKKAGKLVGLIRGD